MLRELRDVILMSLAQYRTRIIQTPPAFETFPFSDWKEIRDYFGWSFGLWFA